MTWESTRAAASRVVAQRPGPRGAEVVLEAGLDDLTSSAVARVCVCVCKTFLPCVVFESAAWTPKSRVSPATRKLKHLLLFGVVVALQGVEVRPFHCNETEEARLKGRGTRRASE